MWKSTSVGEDLGEISGSVGEELGGTSIVASTIPIVESNGKCETKSSEDLDYIDLFDEGEEEYVVIHQEVIILKKKRKKKRLSKQKRRKETGSRSEKVNLGEKKSWFGI